MEVIPTRSPLKTAQKSRWNRPNPFIIQAEIKFLTKPFSAVSRNRNRNPTENRQTEGRPSEILGRPRAGSKISRSEGRPWEILGRPWDMAVWTEGRPWSFRGRPWACPSGSFLSPTWGSTLADWGSTLAPCQGVFLQHPWSDHWITPSFSVH